MLEKCTGKKPCCFSRLNKLDFSAKLQTKHLPVQSGIQRKNITEGELK